MLLVACLLACSPSPASPPASDPPPTAPTPAPPPPPPVRTAPPMDESPISCTTDADCPSLACGPCTAGEKVTQMLTHVNCFRNPCPGQVAVCSAEHVCVARDTIPMTTK